MALDDLLDDLSEELAVASAAQAPVVTTSARALALLSDTAFFAGLLTLLPLSCVSFGTLIVRSRSVPRWLGWFALFGGAVTPSFFLNRMIDPFWYVGVSGMIAALFSHVSIWIHYHATEKPDMDFIYGNKAD